MFLEKVEIDGKKIPRFVPYEKQREKLKGIFLSTFFALSANTLYTGQTNNLEKRMKEHKSKKLKVGKIRPQLRLIELVYSEKHKTRGEAMKREAYLKTWPKV